MLSDVSLEGADCRQQCEDLKRKVRIVTGCTTIRLLVQSQVQNELDICRNLSGSDKKSFIVQFQTSPDGTG